MGEELASRLKVIEKKAEEIWEKGEFYHTYYTLHGIKHSDAVINVLDQLVIGLNPEDQLEEIEIFCLLSAAYLHDVGMQCMYPDDEKDAKSRSQQKNKHYSVEDLIRDEHHLRSGQYIRDHYKTLGLDHIEAKYIRLISQGHREVDLYSVAYDRQPIGLKKVRIRLLSALLRLADELDIDYKRAPETLYEILETNMPDFSKLQWLKHYYTSGLIIEPIMKEGKRALNVEIYCQYPSKEEGRIVTEFLVLSPIKEKIEQLKSIFLRYGLELDLTSKIDLNPDLKKMPELVKTLFCQKNIINNYKLDELLLSIESLKKNQYELVDWGEDSDAWTEAFLDKLKEYHHIYATDVYYRSSLDNSRFNRYLRKQFNERLEDLKCNQNRSLNFSQPVYNAIIKTEWEPDMVMWNGYESKEAICDSQNELEIVRILIRSKDHSSDNQLLENLDYYHRLFAVPLFVLESHHLSPSQLIDFVIGFDKSGKIIACYEFNQNIGKVIEVDTTTRGQFLASEFERILSNDSLKTVDKFIKKEGSVAKNSEKD